MPRSPKPHAPAHRIRTPSNFRDNSFYFIYFAGVSPNVASPRTVHPAYLPQLDGLRGYSMLLVLLAHLPRPSDFPPAALIWRLEHGLKLADIALDGFFMMSGFLITRLLLAERRRTGRIDLKQFYFRRALRIFPIYYLAAAIVLLLWPADLGRGAALLTYTYNAYLPFHPQPYPLEQTWSLAVEEQFYLLWPLLLIALPARWLGRVTLLALPALAIASAVGGALVLPSALAAELTYTMLPTRMLPLALGCFLAVIEGEGHHLGRRTAATAAACGTGLLLLAIGGRAAGLVPAGGWVWAVILPGLSLISLGLITTLIDPATPARLLAPLRWRPARFLGRISYAMYLVHIPLLFAFGINAAALHDGPAPWRWSALVVLLSLLIATASFFLIERPLARLRHRPTTRRSHKPHEEVIKTLTPS